MSKFNVNGCPMAEALVLLVMFISTLFLITKCSHKENINSCDDIKTDTVVADSIK